MKTAASFEYDTDWTKFVAESGSSLERTEELRTRFIQHIQADALRSAAFTIRRDGLGAAYSLSQKADQLDQTQPTQQNYE